MSYWRNAKRSVLKNCNLQCRLAGKALCHFPKLSSKLNCTVLFLHMLLTVIGLNSIYRRYITLREITSVSKFKTLYQSFKSIHETKSPETWMSCLLWWFTFNCEFICHFVITDQQSLVNILVALFEDQLVH